MHVKGIEMNVFAKFNRFFRERIKYKITMHELGALSDRELSDIGLTRSDIYRIAKESVL